MYQNQLLSRLDSPAHRGDLLVDILEGIKVSEVKLAVRDCVPEGMPLREILKKLSTTRQHYFPVLDGQGRFVGIFSTDDVRSYLFDQSIWLQRTRPSFWGCCADATSSTTTTKSCTSSKAKICKLFASEK